MPREFTREVRHANLSAPQLENIPWKAKKFLRGGGETSRGLGGGGGVEQKYIEYNKIN